MFLLSGKYCRHDMALNKRNYGRQKSKYNVQKTVEDALFASHKRSTFSYLLFTIAFAKETRTSV